MSNMKLGATVFLLAAGLGCRTASKGSLVATSRAVYTIAKNDVLRSADKIPDDLWSFQPTPAVRTVGQLFAHIADGQYEFCSPVSEGKQVDKAIEKTATTKADIVSALQESFAYCDAAYAKMTDASAQESTTFFSRPMTRIGIMDFNTAHTMEHYGNLVTYMRLKGIVPPSSESRQ
jgi:uncharacterized damage-inducible protein DinB